MTMLNILKNRSRRFWIVTAIGVVAAAGGMYSLSTGEPAPEYQTAEVKRGDIEVTISASGKIQPKDYVDVGAQVSGQLEAFYVEVGDKVAKGDLLAQIDATIFASSVDAQRAQLKELRASYAQQEATLELSDANAARADMLYKADAISEAEYQAAMAEQKVARARLAQLDAQIERQNSSLKADEATLEFTKIYAPMSGTVVSQAAVEGQTLNANQTTPTILRIADLTVMTVEADVSEADVLRVEKGQDARFKTLGGEEEWRSRVRQVLPQPEVLNDVVLFKVLLDVDNRDERLKPEMTAQVFFITGAVSDAVIVPTAALRDAPSRERSAGPANDGNREGGLIAAQARTDGAENERFARMREILDANPAAERKMVLVLEDGEPRPQPVLVGLRNRSEAEILFGLEPGDSVVTSTVAFSMPVRDDSSRTGPPRGFRSR